jgi:hypothetical protein
MNEQLIQQHIRLALSKAGSRVFRNNQGGYKDATGRWVRYGVANPGGSDLIGWTPVKITPDMLGKTLAVFTAVEVKGPKTKISPEQTNFIDRVKIDGGLAGVARSPEDAITITNQYATQQN